jgi:hypothetical protein
MQHEQQAPQSSIAVSLSATSADALELGRQQLVAFIRRSFDVGIVAVTPISRELRSVRPVPTEVSTNSVNTSRIGRGR